MWELLSAPKIVDSCSNRTMSGIVFIFELFRAARKILTFVEFLPTAVVQPALRRSLHAVVSSSYFEVEQNVQVQVRVRPPAT